ncbi:hypothetical protein CAN33_0018930 [Aspergillus niger]|uniref:Involucrin repeat protein n=1 Tax=Aspergillus niger TaxID=5061 RepID=A0A505I218_ASPNG|nr:hypothetical protein CAN33_0018930 [Aspergillus niger]
MFKALLGGGRSSSDVRSSSSSKSSSRRRTDSKSSTVSRKSSRGDDRDRGLGDLSNYRSSSSRNKRYAPSVAGDSVASSYATADQGTPIESDRVVVERAPRRQDSNDTTDRRDRYRDNGDGEGKSSHRRERARSPSRERERDGDRRERQRTQSGDLYASPVIPGMPPSPGDFATASPHTYPPVTEAMPTTSMPSPPHATAFYDPHVTQQFPGQFPTYVAEPYLPPNPAGEAADYYGDQGQSVQDQPGVRPKPPLVAASDQAHLMTASPTANPPPEPSSMGQVGAAAAYFMDDAELGMEQPEATPSASAPKPPKLSRPPRPSVQTAGISSPPAVTTATTMSGAEVMDSPGHTISESPATYMPPTTSSPPKPPHSHGGGVAVGAAAAGAAAGYMMSQHHQSSASVEHSSQYNMQNYEDVLPAYPETPSFPPPQNIPLHPDHAAVYHGAPFQSGGLAFQQRQQGPLDKFINFWKDPEGVGMFEDYTESIGVCKYCFEPGTTSQDAPRRHNHKPRRRSADRYSNGSRVDKASRYSSSEDEGRRRKRSSRNSWLPGLLGGYAVKSIFSSKEFDESYSIRTGEVASSRHSIHESEGASTAGRRSQTSRGVYRRSHRSRSREHTDHSSYHSDSKLSRYEGSRLRSRSRSRSSSRSQRQAALRNAALGVAVGTAAVSEYESRHRSRSRSASSRGRKPRKASSSDESFVDISRPARKTVGSGFSSFFTASSENRRKRRTKRRKSIFSFSNNNSSSSSLDADLAFGSAYAKRQSGKSNRRSKKKTDTDMDAALLGLGAAATALAASSHRGHRRTGEILVAKESRSGRSDYESSAANDEGWEDLDSGDQSSSSVTSGLAFGESEAAVAAGLGTAALASAYHRDSKVSSHDAASSTGSLQHVAPIPTSDPSRFDAMKVSSQPPSQPTLVRPGPIPLQQPQPVTPVSQAVYTSQGESIPSYSVPDIHPTPASAFMPYETPSRSDRWNQRTADYAERSDISSRISRAHRRSDSSPVFHAEPLERTSTSSFRRRSTLKDQASVQFDLTEEQANKERRANRLESLKREGDAGEGVRLVDREQEMALRDAERRASQQREREYEKSRTEEESSRSEKDSSSLIGAAAVGAIGGVAFGTMRSRSSNDDSSETASQRRHEERREKRRAERRRVSDSESIASSLPMSESGRTVTDVPSQMDRLPEDVRPRQSRPLPRTKPVYEDYAQFFAPEELRYSPDTYTRREPTSMPTIIEVEPANESAVVTEEPHPDYNGLPWPVPGLTLTEPTPPHSQVGSARATPIILIPGRHEEENSFERQTTGSRVSWGKHETHEYEVPSTSSEHESIDQETRVLEHIEEVEPITADTAREMPPSSSTQSATKEAPSMVGADIERSPPTSEPKVQFVSPWEEAPVPRSVPHGFVEGEVETPDDDENIQMAPEYRIEDGPLFSEPRPRTGEELANEPRQSIAQEVIEHLSRRKERNASDSPANQPNLEPASKGVSEIPVEVLSMPGGFEPEESMEKQGKTSDSTSTQERDSPYFVSGPGTKEDGPSPLRDTPEQSSGDIEPNDDDFDPITVGADGGEGKKKRRKRRSKRSSSDNYEDAVSITSSPARLEEKTKETKPGGFLSNLFGSRVSAPVEDKETSFADKHASREVQSEIGSGRREKSSRHRSSSRGDGLDGESRKQDDAENINVEHYKSSRQRREERRRQRYEDMMESGKSSEFEKDREQFQDDEQQSFLEEGPGMPVKVDEGDDHRGASGRLDPDITGLGLDVLDSRPRSRSASPPASEKTANPAPTSQSRPTSPELARSQEENQGQRSRRSSVLRSTESPTAVPLHFRRPPTSPRANRSPSVSSVVAPSPGSPTQGRRRPASTEFKNSREIRPLWLVERFGASKSEAPSDEPLPSLPSSKTSSANASVEDLAALPDVKKWEMVDLSEHVQGPPRAMAVETSAAQNQSSDEGSYDFLDSQQGTPTAASFGQIPHHPPSRKEKLKYEFHSPSELLQDVSVHQELPPSPEIGPLPSAEGSAVGVKEDIGSERVEALPSLPEVRPSTPEDRVLHGEGVAETTPTQTRDDFAKYEPMTDVLSGGDAGTGDDSPLDSQRSAEQITPEKDQTLEEGDHNAKAAASEDLPVQIPTSDLLTSEKDRSIQSAQRNTPVDVAAMVSTAVAAVAGSVLGKPDQTEEPQAREIDHAKNEMSLPEEPGNFQVDFTSKEAGSTPIITGTDSQAVPENVAPALIVDEPVQGKADVDTTSTAVNAGAETEEHNPEQVNAGDVADASHPVPEYASKALDDIVDIAAEPHVEIEGQEKSAPREEAVVESPELVATDETRVADQEIAIQSEETQVDVLQSCEDSSEAKQEPVEAATGDVTENHEPTPADTEKNAGEPTQDQPEGLGASGPEAISVQDTPVEAKEPEGERALVETEISQEVPVSDFAGPTEGEKEPSLSEKAPENEHQEPEPIKTDNTLLSSDPAAEAAGDATNEPLDKETEEPVADSVDLGTPETTPASDEPTTSQEEQNGQNSTEPALSEQVPESTVQELGPVEPAAAIDEIATETAPLPTAAEADPEPSFQETAPAEHPTVTAESTGEVALEPRDDEKLVEIETKEPFPAEQPALTEAPAAESEEQIEPTSQEVPTPGDTSITGEASAEINKPTEQGAQEPQLADQIIPEESEVKTEGMDDVNRDISAPEQPAANMPQDTPAAEEPSTLQEETVIDQPKAEETPASLRTHQGASQDLTAEEAVNAEDTKPSEDSTAVQDNTEVTKASAGLEAAQLAEEAVVKQAADTSEQPQEIEMKTPLEDDATDNQAKPSDEAAATTTGIEDSEPSEKGAKLANEETSQATAAEPDVPTVADVPETSPADNIPRHATESTEDANNSQLHEETTAPTEPVSAPMASHDDSADVVQSEENEASALEHQPEETPKAEGTITIPEETSQELTMANEAIESEPVEFEKVTEQLQMDENLEANTQAQEKEQPSEGQEEKDVPATGPELQKNDTEFADLPAANSAKTIPEPAIPEDNSQEAIEEPDTSLAAATSLETEPTENSQPASSAEAAPEAQPATESALAPEDVAVVDTGAALETESALEPEVAAEVEATPETEAAPEPEIAPETEAATASETVLHTTLAGEEPPEWKLPDEAGDEIKELSSHPEPSQEDSAEPPLLQTSGELPSAAQQNNEASEVVIAEPLADATVSDSTLPVEQTETNDEAPHVPDQSASLAPVEPPLDNTDPTVEPAEVPVAAEEAVAVPEDAPPEDPAVEEPKSLDGKVDLPTNENLEASEGPPLEQSKEAPTEEESPAIAVEKSQSDLAQDATVPSEDAVLENTESADAAENQHHDGTFTDAEPENSADGVSKSEATSTEEQTQDDAERNNTDEVTATETEAPATETADAVHQAPQGDEPSKENAELTDLPEEQPEPKNDGPVSEADAAQEGQTSMADTAENGAPIEKNIEAETAAIEATVSKDDVSTSVEASEEWSPAELAASVDISEQGRADQDTAADAGHEEPSVTLDESQPALAQGDESNETSLEAGSGPTDTPEDISNSAVTENVDTPENTVSEPPAEKPKDIETASSAPAEPTEPVQDFQESSKSKKKAKKDKKKRKSVSFADAEPESQPSEPSDSAADAIGVGQHDDEPVPKGDAHSELCQDSHDAELSQSQEAEPASEQPAEGTPLEQTLDLPDESQATVSDAIGLEDVGQHSSEPMAEEKIEESEDPVTLPSYEVDAAEKTPKSESVEDPSGTPKETGKEDEPAADTMATGTAEQLQPEGSPEANDAQPSATEADTQPVNATAEQDKANEDTGADDGPSEPVTPIDPDTPADPELSTEPETPVGPQTPLEPESAVEPETVVEPETPVNATIPALHDSEVVGPQPEDPEKETPPMSAKAKKKAKKDKKRQSKSLADATEPADETRHSSDAQVPSETKTAEQSLETANVPAEDDGKDNQSHGTENHGENDKDLIWTDDMVSPQVEQQQATSFAYPPQLEHEKTEDDPVSIPPDEVLKPVELDANISSQNEQLSLNELEESGDAHENSNTQPAESMAKPDDGTGQTSVEEQGEFSTDRNVVEDVFTQDVVEEKEQASIGEGAGQEDEQLVKKDESLGVSPENELADEATEMRVEEVIQAPEITQQGESVEGAAEIEDSTTNVPSKKKSKKEKKKKRQAEQTASRDETEQGVSVQDNDQARGTAIPDELPVETAAPSIEPGPDAPFMPAGSPMSEEEPAVHDLETAAPVEGHGEEAEHPNDVPVESELDSGDKLLDASTIVQPEKDTPEEHAISEGVTPEAAEGEAAVDEAAEPRVESEAVPGNELVDQQEVTEAPSKQVLEPTEDKDSLDAVQDDATLNEVVDEPATSADKTLEPAPEDLGFPMEPEQSPQGNTVRDEDNNTSSVAEATAAFPSDVAQDETNKEAVLTPKESKKKKKKAKKQAKDEQNSPTLAPAEGAVTADEGLVGLTYTLDTTRSPVEEPSNALHDKQWDTPPAQDDGDKEQNQTSQIEEEPVRSAEEFDEHREVSTAERQGVVVQQELESANAEQDTKTLTEKHDLAKTEDLSENIPDQPEASARLTKKLSKKERRKAKQRAEQELVESDRGQQPDFDAGASADPIPVQEQVTEVPDALAAEQAKMDDVSPGLPSGEEEKRLESQTLDVKNPEGEQPHKKDATSFLQQETETPAWEQRAQDDDSWPIIDWEKSEVDATERSPDSSPEARAVPFEPGIADFDENAIPEGVIRHPSASTATGKTTARAFQQIRGDVQATSEATTVPPISPSTALDIEHSIYAKTSSESLGSESQKQSKVASIFPELERGFFRRPAPVEPSESAKDGAEEETIDKEAIRDSAIVLEAPISTANSPSSGQGDAKTATEPTQADESTQSETGLHPSSNEPTIEVEADTSYNVSVLSDGPEEKSRQIDIRWEEQKDKESPREVEAETAEPGPFSHHEAPLYAPSPVHERQSVLVRSGSPSGRDIGRETSRSSPTCELRRSPSIHGRHNQTRRPWSLEVDQNSQPRTPSPQPTGVDRETVSPPRTPLQTIEEDEPRGRTERSTGSRTVGHERGTPRLEMKPEHVLPRPETPTRKFTDNALARQAWPTPDKETPFDENTDVEVKKRRPESRVVDGRWPAEVLKTPEQDKPILRPTSSSIRGVKSMHNITPNLEQTPTPRSLRRNHRTASGDLRAAATTQAQETDDQSERKPQPPASSASDLNLERIASSSSYDPVTDKGKRPLRNMTDVYEGWGETPSSPRSPSRPPSIRHRRSMQHLQELESRLDRLISENRLLAAAREEAEDKLRKTSVARRKSDHALNSRDADLRDKDAEVEQLKSSLEWLQKEVARLTEENTGLATTSSNLTATHAQEVQVMQETFDRQVDELRSENQQLSAEMHDRVRQEVEMALAQKDMELRRLREELENARDKVKQLQQQIAAAMQDDVLVFRDEDYFDAACQKLCGHVQQWVLRFSKHSDHRRCRKLSDLQDEKIADRFDNAILDGSDVDTYLSDRVRRRDVFMSVVMTMVWEFIFTRYLFGMDREQRQKLKSLEKQLADIGPRSAIHRWRATTLTLLSKRPTFSKQRESDTEAVALEIFDTLSRLLPPPTNVEAQLLDSLRKVLRVAVHLSIEMRTQLAEYIMLPPLQPEYDTNGDLARQVYFNASLMNERSGETTSNEELETQQAVVRVVLFPLVVKKGNDRGEGDDEVVVCPAQVLIARPNKDKKVVKMLSGDRMSLDATRSVHSVAPSSTMDMSNVI